MGQSASLKYKAEELPKAAWWSGGVGAVIGLSCVFMIGIGFLSTNQPNGGFVHQIITPASRTLLAPPGINNIYGHGISTLPNEVLPAGGNPIGTSAPFYEGSVTVRFGVIYPIPILIVAQLLCSLMAFLPLMFPQQSSEQASYKDAYERNVNWYWELVPAVTTPLLEFTFLVALGVQEVVLLWLFFTFSATAHIIRILGLKKTHDSKKGGYSPATNSSWNAVVETLDAHDYFLATAIKLVIWATILYFSFVNAAQTITGTPAVLIGGPIWSPNVMAAAVWLGFILFGTAWIFRGVAESVRERYIWEVLHMVIYGLFVFLSSWLMFGAMM